MPLSEVLGRYGTDDVQHRQKPGLSGRVGCENPVESPCAVIFQNTGVDTVLIGDGTEKFKCFNTDAAYAGYKVQTTAKNGTWEPMESRCVAQDRS